MNWLCYRVYRFAFKFGSNNNTRSNTGMLLVVAAVILYWYFCSGGQSSGNMSLTYRNRHVWGAQELCNRCSNSWSFISTPWCSVTRWISTWGLLIAIGYWFIARRDEVGRIWEGTVERVLIDQGGTQDLPDQPTNQTPGGTNTPASAPQRPQRSAFWWFRWDLFSNFLSDLISGLFLRRFHL